jgi:hypothetical protein
VTAVFAAVIKKSGIGKGAAAHAARLSSIHYCAGRSCATSYGSHKVGHGIENAMELVAYFYRNGLMWGDDDLQ